MAPMTRAGYSRTVSPIHVRRHRERWREGAELNRPLPRLGPEFYSRITTSDLGGPMRAVAVPSCLLGFLVPALHAQAAPTAKPALLHWGPAPAVFPKGAKMAVVAGDPAQATPFTVELAMPAGYKIPPHFHPTDE